MEAPRIYYFTPYHPEGLGRAYNEHCALVPNDDDWICLMDSDVMFFSSQRLGDQLSEAVQQFPDYSVFTCVTNRMCGEQQLRGPIRGERDLVKLKQAADDHAKRYRGIVAPLRGFFAGYFLFFPKRLWREIPFPEVGSQGGKILGIDSAWSAKVHLEGKRVGLLQGLLAVHFYRLDTHESDISHLPDDGHNPNQPHVWNGFRPIAPARPAKLRLNPNLRPPGGYKFVDADRVEHVAESAEKLAANLARFRARLNLPPGEPLKEITQQIYERHPAFCLT